MKMRAAIANECISRKSRGYLELSHWEETMPDKVLVTNCSALTQKYGSDGFKAVQAAIGTLVAADKARGLTTKLFDISNPAQMKTVKGAAVSSVKSERQCKDAVDAIYAALRPDYIAILDGPDVVPHLALNNPTPGDKDANVPSDLPYASDAPFTSRDAAKYAAVTRVVGRVTGITGAKDPSFLVAQLKNSAAFKGQKRDNYLPYFAISAEVWQKSTEESVGNIFNGKTIKICPPTGSPAVSKLLAPLSHFINCHGAQSDPQFYGQHGSQYPVSMNSGDVTKGAKRNTIVAAECCYGAQLFDPSWASGQLPISNAYLGAGAAAFFGSSTIAYGPAEGNGAADLLTQYFLINVLASASLGRACLQARQEFVKGQKMEDPVNLKTLAQFILLADPSLQPCPDVSKKAKEVAKVIDQDAAREVRRTALVAFGKAAADSSGFPGPKVTRPAKSLHDLVRKIARDRGIRAAVANVEAFHVVGGGDYGKEMKARGVEQKVFVVTDYSASAGKRPKHLPMTRILVAHAQDNRVVEVAEYDRR
jgi:hypothetical protein